MFAGVIVFAVVLALAGCGRQTGAPAAATKTASVQQKAGSTPSAFTGQWVEISLANGESYFGRIGDHGAASVILWDVYYLTRTKAGEAGELTRLGSELHKPQQIMIVPISSLRSWQELGDKSKVIEAIQAAGDKGSDQPTDAALQSAKAYAVFLQDGRVVFGGVQPIDIWTGVSNGYVLARKDPEAPADDPIKSLSDLQLVAQADAKLGLTPVLWVRSDTIVFYEPLADDSPVVKALAAQGAEK